MEDISIMVEDVKFNFRVGAILEYDSKVIIEKCNHVDFGVIPGGRVKTLEDTKSALIREIQEEMHFDISNKEIKLQDIIENFFEMNNTKYHELYFIYRVKLDKEDKILNMTKDEFVNYDSKDGYYEYVPLDKIKDESIKPDALKEIICSNKFDTKVVRDC